MCCNTEQQIIIIAAVNAMCLMRNEIFGIFQRSNEVDNFDWSFARTLFVNDKIYNETGKSDEIKQKFSNKKMTHTLEPLTKISQFCQFAWYFALFDMYSINAFSKLTIKLVPGEMAFESNCVCNTFSRSLFSNKKSNKTKFKNNHSKRFLQIKMTDLKLTFARVELPIWHVVQLHQLTKTVPLTVWYDEVFQCGKKFAQTPALPNSIRHRVFPMATDSSPMMLCEWDYSNRCAGNHIVATMGVHRE